MDAVAEAKAWETALRLLEESETTPFDDCSKDMPFYGIAIRAAGRAGKWQVCLHMLQEMLDNHQEPDDRAFACTHRAIIEAVKGSPVAKFVKDEMNQRQLQLPDWVKDPLRDPEHLLETPEMRFPMPLADLIKYARKEVYLLKWVQQKSKQGDVESVISAIEQFAVERRWLKVQGDEKKELLEKNLRPTDRIVEFGCYVGYSSLCMAKRMRDLGGQGSVTSVDVDASTAYIARAVHQWAGVEGEAQIRVGAATDWLATKHLGTIDFLLLDHRGTIYHDDLYSAEPYLSPTAIVWADNVLYPGAPLFLNYIDVQGYKIEIVDLKEFLRPDLDDWVVIAKPPPPEKRKPKPTQHPAELRRLSAEVDSISWRSQNQEVDWVGFQKRVNPIFFKWRKDTLGY
jgi:catechol O-methyltransferase